MTHALPRCRAMLLALALGGATLAQAQDLPAPGVRAEADQQWDQAIAVYTEALRITPDRADLWRRLGQIHARQGEPEAAADAFARAAALRPDDSNFQVDASQAHAMAEQWPEALAAISRAVALEPDNAEYVRARAQLANANGDTVLARDSYARLVVLIPGDEEGQLGLLQTRTWLGELDAAATGYATFLAAHPTHRQALLDAARVELWRGNSARSLELLDVYAAAHGRTEDYRRLRARVLARANRATHAFEELHTLWADSPRDFDSTYTQTVAFVNGRQPGASVAALHELEAQWPDRPEMSDMRRFVMTRLRTNATVEADYFQDSDDIEIVRSAVWGEYALSPDTFLAAGGEYQWLTAPRGSGLNNRDGGKTANYTEEWVGGRHRFSSQWAVNARAGVGVSDGETEGIYRLGIDYDPRDDLAFTLRQDRVFHTVSPRAVSHHIYQDRTQVRGSWQVDLRHTIDVEASVGAFSDGNTRYQVSIAPRRVVLRREHYNLDIGVSALWFRFEDDENHGYYDPQRFQRYMLTTFHYWKINDDDGISLALAAGVTEDNLRDEFDFAADAVVRGTFGLFRDWQFVVYGAALMNEQSLRGVDDYSAGRVGFALTRRF